MLQQLNQEQALYLLQLRTIIVRAAQKDSLRWWDDESLTKQGSYILERIFPGSPALTARNLALHAATVRHDTVIQGFHYATHLFRISLDNIDLLAMRSLRNHFMEGITNILDPIPDLDTLRQRLLAVIGTPPRYERQEFLNQNGGLQIWLHHESTTFTERVNALAWAYLESTMEKPVIPYIIGEPITNA